MNSFSDIFKKLRLERRFTQTELANELGLSRSTISMYESGKRFPDHAGMLAIADFFHVTPDYLYGKSDCMYATHEDNSFIFFYNNDDLQFYHDSVDALVKDLSTSDLLKKVLKTDNIIGDYEFSDDQLVSILNFARFIAKGE